MGSSLGSAAASMNIQSRLPSALLQNLEGQENVHRERAPVAMWVAAGMDILSIFGWEEKLPGSVPSA